MRNNRRAFTLVEILIAIAIFAIGGVAILSLFIANAAAATKAADASRAREIAESVRATIEASLSSPPVMLQLDPDSFGRGIYPISFPFASLTNYSPRYGPNKQSADNRLSGTAEFDTEVLEKPQTFYFELPTEDYQGPTNIRRNAYTVLPKDILTISGQPASVPGERGQSARVWYVLPTEVAAKGLPTEVSRVDLDDSDLYSFSFFIRRGVSRHSNRPGAPTERVQGLYVVQLRIYRGYDPDRVDNRPVHEFSFTVAAAQ